jgi:hypothetical protein
MNLSSGRVAVLLGSVVAAFSSPAISASIPNQKAGVASAVYLDRDPQKLVALGAIWAYHWSARVQPTTPTDGWLPRFMRLVHQRHLRVNFIALHYYLDFTNPGSVAAMRAQLIQVHNRYHRPIWITELGALDIHQWGQPMLHPQSSAFAQTYMRNVFAMLNALPFVQRYAWYTDSCAGQSGCRYSSLFSDSGTLTAEGREFKGNA